MITYIAETELSFNFLHSIHSNSYKLSLDLIHVGNLFGLNDCLNATCRDLDQEKRQEALLIVRYDQ